VSAPVSPAPAVVLPHGFRVVSTGTHIDTCCGRHAPAERRTITVASPTGARYILRERAFGGGCVRLAWTSRALLASGEVDPSGTGAHGTIGGRSIDGLIADLHSEERVRPASTWDRYRDASHRDLMAAKGRRS
jgi:hypothetical protein